MPVITPTTKKLAEAMKIENIHAVPRITKVMVTVGVGKNRDNKQYVEAIQKDLAAITGQKPKETHAKKSIAGFNVREGNLVGYSVTLRGKRMEDFITRFVDVTLPRVRDFRGLSLKVLDGYGNASIGLTEQLAFPEIHADKTDVIFGVGITFVSTAKDNQTAEQMLRALGFPFRGVDELDEK
ncbi:MAG: 50S ribosomal protein L5 [Candidatus Andersenbacteria bacterium]|nr:50S ribosomal protein L5 [Candidatus Andersenbacteria bacterium]